MATPQSVELQTEMLLRIRDMSASGFNSFKNSAKSATDSLGLIRNGFGSLESKATGFFGHATTGVTKLRESMSEVSGIALGNLFGGLGISALTDATEGVENLGKSLIATNAQLEQVHQTFTVLYSGNTGDADQAINYLNQFALQAPFTRQAVYSAGTSIAALGLPIQDVMPSLGNLAAAMHTTLPTAAQALSDAFEGRFYMMQRDLHVTKAQLQDFGLQVDNTGHVVQASLIPALQKFTQATGMMGNGNSGTSAMARMLNTFQGALSNLTDAFQNAQLILGAPIFAVVESNITQFVAIIRNNLIGSGNGVQTAFQVSLANIGQEIAKFVTVFFALTRVFIENLPQIESGIRSTADRVIPIFDALKSSVTTSVGTIRNVLQSVGGEAMAAVFTKMATVIAFAISGIVFDLSRFILVWGTIARVAQAVLPTISSAFSGIQGVITNLVSSTGGRFNTMFNGALDSLKAFITAISGPAKEVIASIAVSVEMVSKQVMSMGGTASGIGRYFTQGAQLALQAFASIIRDAGRVIVVLLQFIPTIVRVGTQFGQAIAPGVAIAFNAVVSGVGRARSALASFGSSNIGSIVSAFTTLARVVGAGLVQAFQAIASAFQLVHQNSATMAAAILGLALVFRGQLIGAFTNGYAAIMRWTNGLAQGRAASAATKAMQESMIGTTAQEAEARVAAGTVTIAASKAEIEALGQEDSALKTNLQANLASQEAAQRRNTIVAESLRAKQAERDALSGVTQAMREQVIADRDLAVATAAEAREDAELAKAASRVVQAQAALDYSTGAITRAQYDLTIAITDATIDMEEQTAVNAELSASYLSASAAAIRDAEAQFTLAGAIMDATGALMAQAAALITTMAPMVAIGVGLMLLMKLYQQHKQQIDAFIQSISGPLLNGLNQAKNAILAFFQSINFGQNAQAVLRAIVTGVQALANVLSGPIQTVISTTVGWFNQLQQAFSGSSDQMQATTTGMSASVQLIEGTFNGLRTTITIVLSTIETAFQNNRTTIMNILTSVGQFIQSETQFWWNAFKLPIDLIVDLVSGNFSKMATDVKADLGGMLEGLEGMFGQAVKLIIAALTLLINGFILQTNMIGKLLNQQYLLFANFAGKVAGLFARLGPLVKDLASNAMYAAVAEVEKGWNSLVGKIPGLGSHITINAGQGSIMSPGAIGNDMNKASNMVSSDVTKLLDQHNPLANLPQIPYLNSDGIIKAVQAGTSELQKLTARALPGSPTGGPVGPQMITDPKMLSNSDIMVRFFSQQYNQSVIAQGQNNNLFTRLATAINQGQLNIELQRIAEFNNDFVQLSKAHNTVVENEELANLINLNNERLQSAALLKNAAVQQAATAKITGQNNELKVIMKDNATAAKGANAILHTAQMNPYKANVSLAAWQKQQLEAIRQENLSQFDPAKRADIQQAQQEAIRQAVANVEAAIKGGKDKNDKYAKFDPNNPNNTGTTVQNLSKAFDALNHLYTAAQQAQAVVTSLTGPNGDRRNVTNPELADAKSTKAAYLEKYNQIIQYVKESKIDYFQFSDIFGEKLANQFRQAFIDAQKAPETYHTGVTPNKRDLAQKVPGDPTSELRDLKNTYESDRQKYEDAVRSGASMQAILAAFNTTREAFLKYETFGNQTKQQQTVDQELVNKPMDILGTQLMAAMEKQMRADVQQKASSQVLATDKYNIQTAGRLAGYSPQTVNNAIFSIMVPYFKGIETTMRQQLSTDMQNNASQSTILKDIKAVETAMKNEGASHAAILNAQVIMFRDAFDKKVTSDKAQFSTDITNNATTQQIMKDMQNTFHDMALAGATPSEIKKQADDFQSSLNKKAKANMTAFDFGSTVTAPPNIRNADFGGVDLSFGIAGGSAQNQIVARLEEALQQARQQNIYLEQLVTELSNQDNTLKGIASSAAEQAAAGTSTADKTQLLIDATNKGHDKVASAVKSIPVGKGGENTSMRLKGQGSQKSLPY